MLVDSDYRIEALEKDSAKAEFFMLLKKEGYDMYDIDPDTHVNAFTYPHKPVSLEVLLKRKPSCYVQRIQGMRGKPYTQDLVNNEIHDYDVLRKHYDKIEEDMRDVALKG